MILYSKYQHNYSWHGQDTFEIHEVLTTGGGWIAAELSAGFDDESEGPMKAMETWNFMQISPSPKSRSNTFLPVLYGNKNLYGEHQIFSKLFNPRRSKVHFSTFK